MIGSGTVLAFPGRPLVQSSPCQVGFERLELSRILDLYGRMVAAGEWRWSSTRALLDPARGDGITETAPVLERVPDFAALLRSGEDETLSAALRKAESIGRPLGDSAFLDRVEALLGRDPKPGKRGPRPRHVELNALSP